MKNKIWAIGDLHGHYKELLALYKKLLRAGMDPSKDILVFLGDYVDGGPDAKGVLDWLIKKEQEYPHWVFLYGNHEDLMLDALVFNGNQYNDYYLWWNQGGRETTKSYLPAFKGKNPTEEEKLQRALMEPKLMIPLEHLSWLVERPVFYETENYFFVHAGVPDIPLKELVNELTNKIGNMAQKKSRVQDVIWMRDSFIGSKYNWGKKIIFGHTVWPYSSWFAKDAKGKPIKEFGYPFVSKNKIGIDGMAHNEGQLIAVELPAEKFYYQKSLSHE